MPPRPGEQPPPEQTTYEQYKPSLEKQREVVKDLFSRLGDDAAAKTETLRGQNTEISKLLAQLTRTEEAGETKDELDGIAQQIESAIQIFNTEFQRIQEELLEQERKGSDWENKEHGEFVEKRKQLLGTIDNGIKDAKDADPKLREELENIRSEILAVTIDGADENNRSLVIFKQENKNAEPTDDRKDKRKMQVILNEIKKKSEIEKEKKLIGLKQKMEKKFDEIVEAERKKNKEAADKKKQEEADKKKQEEGEKVTARGGRARAELQKALGGLERPEQVAEKLKDRMPEILAAAFADFLGDPRKPKDQIAREKEQFLNTIVWKEILGKTGDPLLHPDGSLNTTVPGEANRFKKEKEMLTALIDAAKKMVENEAAARITKEKSTKRERVKFWGEIAVLSGAGVAAGTIATGGTLLVALGGITAVRVARGLWADRAVRGKPKEVSAEWKTNDSKKKELQTLLQDFFVAQHHERTRKDTSPGASDELSNLRGQFARKRDAGERAGAVADYRSKARNRADQLEITIDAQLRTEREALGNAITHETNPKKAATLQKEFDELTDENIKNIAKSSADLYVMDQLHLLAEEETAAHLESGRYWEGKLFKGTEKIIDRLSLTKQVKEKWKNAAVMGTIGLVAREMPVLREVMMAYGGMQAGAALGEAAYRRIEKRRGGKESLPPPTMQELAALRESLKTATDATPEGKTELQDLMERVKIQMADARLYLSSDAVKNRKLESAGLQRELEQLEDMMAAQSTVIGLEGKMVELYETVREKGTKEVQREEWRRRSKIIGAVVGLGAGLVAGEYLRHRAEDMQADRLQARKSAIDAGENAKSDIKIDVKEATSAYNAAVAAEAAAKKSVGEVTAAKADTASFYDMKEKVENVRNAAVEARKGATEVAKQLAEAEVRAKVADAAAAKAAEAAKHYGVGFPGFGGEDTYKTAMAAKETTAAAAADVHHDLEAARRMAEEADTAARQAEELSAQADAALEAKKAGEPFSEALRQEDTNYRPIGETRPGGSGVAPSERSDRWFGGEWNADGKESGETLRYSLDARNFMRDHNISVDEKSGKLILHNDNEDITFRASGTGSITRIEIDATEKDLDGNGKVEKCLAVKTIDNSDNFRIMYIRDNGQYHGDFEGDVPRTGSLESQAYAREHGPLTKATDYFTEEARCDKVTALRYRDGFLSASEIKGADGVVLQLDLAKEGEDGSFVSNAEPSTAQYTYKQMAPDGHAIVDSGVITRNGRISSASIAERLQALNFSSLRFDLANPDPREIVLAFSVLQKGEEALGKDISEFPGYTDHQEAAKALGIHVRDGHLHFPPNLDKSNLQKLFKDPNKLAMCGADKERLIFALTHLDKTNTELTTIFQNQEHYADVVVGPVSPDQAYALQEAFEGFDVKSVFLFDSSGLHLRTADGHIAKFALTGDPTKLSLEGITSGRVRSLVERATAEAGYQKQLQTALAVAGKPDADFAKILNMRYGDFQDKGKFFRSLGVREHAQLNPLSWFGSGVSANRAHRELGRIMDTIFTAGTKPYNAKSVLENLRLALEKKFSVKKSWH